MASCICFIRNLNVCVIVQSECNVTFVSTLELLIFVNYDSVLIATFGALYLECMYDKGSVTVLKDTCMFSCHVDVWIAPKYCRTVADY